MVGTGTQSDPYQITTIDEFRSMNNASAYYKLMNNIDLNNTIYYQNWTKATTVFKSLDGNNKYISNFFLNSDSDGLFSCSPNSIFENLMLKNIEVNRIGFFRAVQTSLGSRISFNSCQIDGNIIVSAEEYGTIGDIVNYNFCEINLAIRTPSFITGLSTNGTMQNCNVGLDLTLTNNAYSGSLIYQYDTNLVNHTTIKGKINSLNGSMGMFVAGKVQDSTISMTTNNISSIKVANSAVYGSVAINKDKMPNTIITPQTGVYECTNAQFKSKAYLNSIGLVVK